MRIAIDGFKLDGIRKQSLTGTLKALPAHIWATQTMTAESKPYSEEIMRAPFLLGRLLFGGYFIFSGINHFKQTRELSQYSAYGFANPHGRAFDYWGTDLITDATGNDSYFGPAFSGYLEYPLKHPKMHDFWKQEEPQQRMNDMINFTKNLALAGAATALMGVEEPWPASVTPKPTARQRAKRILRESIAA